MTTISPTVPKIWSMADRIFCHFGPFFALLYALTTWKIKILKKMKKSPGYIIPLHMCTIHDNHMMHGSWDMERNGLNFFVILDHFLPFYPPDNPKNQNFEKMKKKPWRYYYFTHVYHKLQSYYVLFLRYRAQQTELFVILDHFLAKTAQNSMKNQN